MTYQTLLLGIHPLAVFHQNLNKKLHLGTGLKCLINLVEKCRKIKLLKNDKKDETFQTCSLVFLNKGEL